MDNAASVSEIVRYLGKVKKLVSAGRYDFVPRRKNMSALAQHGMTIEDAKSEILGLIAGDYYKGPKQDFDSGRPGDVWEFKKQIDGIQFYVKVKIVQGSMRTITADERRAIPVKKYCEECGEDVETKIVTKKESYNVFGEKIEVDALILVCAECGEELFCEELDSRTLVAVYNTYRKKHKLLLPEEIREIREKYGLSQRSFSKLLNWGDKTIFRYENGSIQDKAHNSLLLFLRDPENMRTFLTENEVLLDEKQKNKLLKVVSELEQSTEKRNGGKFFEMFFSRIPDEENGFKTFDYEKTCAMVLFFANKTEELLKTKLMKLLCYADMIFYKENGVSISGLRYAHLPYGPVPDNFDMLLGKMAADHIAHIEINYDNGYEKHQLVPETGVPDGILSKAEIEVLERINEKFCGFGSAEISNYSHNETGYMSTKTGEIISYAYAKDIVLE